MERKDTGAFMVGDHVVILGPIGRYLHRKGIVLQIKPFRTVSPVTSELDKYLVKFADADQGWFFCISCR
jgi:hypothetical protein